MGDIIYFDNSAATCIFPEVLDEMNGIYAKCFGNPSSLHKMGAEADKILQNARETIARTLGVTEREIFFTSGGTESNNWAIKGASRANKKRGKKIITSGAEHPSVTECFSYLETEGFSAEYLETDNRGLLDPHMLGEKIDENTILASFIMLNNETGATQNTEELIRVIRRKNPSALIHIDAVQAYGKIPINLSALDADLMSFSSHKIHGPKGCGALYIKRNVRLLPIIHGGGQENRQRSGTENVPAVHGFAKAAEIIHRNINKNRTAVKRLKSIIIEGLTNHFGGDNFFLNSPLDAYEGIVNIAFPRVKAQVLMQHLEAVNIYVSVGSACSSRKNIHSRVLTAMKLPKENIEGAVRLSFSGMNTEDEALRFIEAIKEIIPKIKY